ncbi:hypothetical protein SCALM49S_09164 [Streptomyces californicus]
MVAVAVAAARMASGKKCLRRRSAGMRGFTKVSPMRWMKAERSRAAGAAPLHGCRPSRFRGRRAGPRARLHQRCEVRVLSGAG